MKARLELCHGAVRDIKTYSLEENITIYKELSITSLADVRE